MTSFVNKGKMMKIKVKEVREIYAEDFFDRPIDDIIKIFEDYKKEGWEEIYYSIQYEGIDFYLRKNRLETDDEYNARMERVKKQQIKEEKDKEKRRNLYEELKIEFEEK